MFRVWRAAVACAALWVVASVGGGAQVREAPGAWAPSRTLNQYLSGGSFRPAEFTLTPAQTAELQRVVDVIEGVFKRAAALKEPTGYEVRLSSHTWYRDLSTSRYQPGQPFPLNVSLGFFPRYRECDSCPIKVAIEPSGGLDVWLNDVEGALEEATPAPQSPREPRWWLVRRVIGEEHGVPVLEGGFGQFVMAGPNRPLGVDVPRLAYLDRVLADRRARQRTAATSVANLPAEQQRALADMEAAARDLAASNPSAAAEMLRQLGDVRRQLEGSARGVADEAASGLATTAELIRQIEEERARLSEAERRATTWQAASGAPRYRGGAVIVDEDDTSHPRPQERPSARVDDDYWGRRVVTPNPEFYDRRLPLTHPQLLVLEAFQGGDPTAAEVNDPYMFAFRKRIYQTLDWAALRAVVAP